MTRTDTLEKAKILFDIAQTEYRHEIELHKVASDRAAKMVSFTGLLFTIFSFLVVRVMLAPGAAGGFPWAEWAAYWAAYIVSAALVVLIMWAMLSLMNAIRRDIQSEGGITAAQFLPFDEDGYSAADVYRAGRAAYWQAVDASRQHTATLVRILRRTDRLIRLSFILLGILAILLFLLT